MFFEKKNPNYSIKFPAKEPPILGFSKRLDNDFNPKSAFAAIMSWNSLKEACSILSGAEKRFPIMYENPKAYDTTP